MHFFAQNMRMLCLGNTIFDNLLESIPNCIKNKRQPWKILIDSIEFGWYETKLYELKIDEIISTYVKFECCV